MVVWHSNHPATNETIGILAFEVAAAMSRLVSLHRSLSDPFILNLRSNLMRSQAVAYLTSTDQPLLLRLACAELVDDLDATAAHISRLARRCTTPLPEDFHTLYSDLKSGSGDPMIVLKVLDKMSKRMERYLASTSKLYEELQLLEQLDAVERKLIQRLGSNSGPIPKQASPHEAARMEVSLKSQRSKVRRLKEESLWGETFDKVVALMGRAVLAIFARVCVVFGPFVPGLPPVVVSASGGLLRFTKMRIYPRFPGRHASSGPLERRPEVAIRNSCPIIGSEKSEKMVADWKRMLLAPVGSVGEAGLTVRYASLIVLAERLLAMRVAEGALGAEERREEAATREEIYEMMPAGMKGAVKGKMRDWWRRDAGGFDGSLAEGWKEAVEGIMGWLGPIAHDTIQWQAERNMDRSMRFDPRPRTLLLQTLHFSDREKTEAAIAEVLVGLSLVGWYEERRHLSSIRL